MKIFKLRTELDQVILLKLNHCSRGQRSSNSKHTVLPLSSIQALTKSPFVQCSCLPAAKTDSIQLSFLISTHQSIMVGSSAIAAKIKWQGFNVIISNIQSTLLLFKDDWNHCLKNPQGTQGPRDQVPKSSENSTLRNKLLSVELQTSRELLLRASPKLTSRGFPPSAHRRPALLHKITFTEVKVFKKKNLFMREPIL